MTPVAMILIFLAVVLCALILSNMLNTNKYLKTEPVKAHEIEGTFTLVLYGGSDPKQAAFLDIEGDDYLFHINDSRHNFTSKKNVPAKQALDEAISFLDSQNHRIFRILHKKKTVGYEIRPVYHAGQFGHPDILDIQYMMKRRTVRITVEISHLIKESYERDMYGGE